MANATSPGQMQSSKDHNKQNSTTVQVYHPRTGAKQRQLCQVQVPGFEHPINHQLGRKHQ
jgi:hypothetical protein